jgi:quinol monooxygenase YgiN
MTRWFLAGLVVLGIAGARAEAADVRMYLRHEVADYATWRKAYDAFAADRRKLGVRSAAVFQSIDNPNEVTLTHDFKTAERAKSFAASPQVKEAMEKAGVKGTPQFWYTMRAKM